MLTEFFKENTFLQFVHFFYSMKHAHLITVQLSSFDKSFNVFRETRTAIADARIQEFASDTGVRTNAATHHIDVCTYQFAKIGNIVHETDAGSKHGIGCIFGHFSGWNIHEDDAKVV